MRFNFFPFTSHEFELCSFTLHLSYLNNKLMNKIIRNKEMCLILLLFCLGDTTLYPKKRCEKDDCSYQLPYTENGRCIIHNTTVCLQWFTILSHPTELLLKSEDASKFSVSVIPYNAEFHDHEMQVFLSAINITFTMQQKGVKGLAVKIREEEQNKTICRIFDFQTLGSNFSLPVNLFYDCLFNLAENNIQNVQMDFIALPMNEKLSYFVFFPSATQLLKSICDWKPVIMIFCSQLLKGVLKVKFSCAPEQLNILFYSVQLIEKSSNKQKYVLRLPFNLKREMVSAEFSSVDEGNYSVIVTASTEEIKDCSGTETGTFLVGNSELDIMLVLYMYICIIILFTSCGFAFLKLYNHFVRFKYANRPPRVLLLYSYDCSHHKDFVGTFINYLTSHCYLQVHTLYGSNGSPTEWLTEKYKNSDIIVFLISEGLFHTLNQKHVIPVGKVDHWWRQLLDAKNFIFYQFFDSHDDFKKKKICNICFPYSSKEHIPECLKNITGKCYMLPEEMNSLLCFMHDFHLIIPCLNLYPSLSGSSFQSSPEGKSLLEKMKAFQTAIENNSHISSETSKNITDIIDMAAVSDKNSLHVKEEYKLCPSSESMSSLGSEESSNSYVKEFLLDQILKDSPGENYQEFNMMDSSLDINQFFAEREELDSTPSCKFTNTFDSSVDEGKNEDSFLLNCLPENVSNSDDEDRFYEYLVDDILLQKGGT